jgi:hypothetical protein
VRVDTEAEPLDLEELEDALVQIIVERAVKAAAVGEAAAEKRKAAAETANRSPLRQKLPAR